MTTHIYNTLPSLWDDIEPNPADMDGETYGPALDGGTWEYWMAQP